MFVFCSLIVPTLFFNTYKGWAVLYICGSAEFLYSRYRVMHYKCFLHSRYSPIIRLLKESSKWTQVWYADDVSACGELSHICGWFDLLLHHGSLYVYYPNPSKCCVIVDYSCHDCAIQIFSPFRCLGG